jgi:hypothetical protein
LAVAAISHRISGSKAGRSTAGGPRQPSAGKLAEASSRFARCALPYAPDSAWRRQAVIPHGRGTGRAAHRGHRRGRERDDRAAPAATATIAIGLALIVLGVVRTSVDNGIGLPVFGICNGFQILCEAHLLPAR